MQPSLLSIPFAENGLKNTIPNDRSSGTAAEAATYNDGFPPVTMTPVAAGGLPPSGQDMNGILYALSNHISFMNKGSRYQFDADFATAIGGYPKGAILISDDNTQEYISLVDNNTHNFNTDPSSIGTYWNKYADVQGLKNELGTAAYQNIDYFTGRLLNVQTFNTSGSYTPTEGTTSIIVEVLGAGGGGAGSLDCTTGQWSQGFGGCGGAYAKKRFNISELTLPVSVVVGAGGNGGTLATNFVGSSGGSSTFATVTASGGNGGGRG